MSMVKKSGMELDIENIKDSDEMIEDLIDKERKREWKEINEGEKKNKVVELKKSFVKTSDSVDKKYKGDIDLKLEDTNSSAPKTKKEVIDSETKVSDSTTPKPKKPVIDVAAIAREIKGEQIKDQRAPVEGIADKDLKGRPVRQFVKTGIEGFDELLDKGIPKGNAILVSGGAGSGKTILVMQTLIHHAQAGKRCLIMSLEEREIKLIQHMEDFGWPAQKLIDNGNLKVIRMNPFDITRNVDALLAKQKGELLIDIDPILIPKDFKKPDFIAIDSLTAIASAFTGKDESYRIYIEQLFRFLEKIGATSFLIAETEQVPKIFSPTGVEEFLADGVVVLYNLRHGNVRENAIEILKLRGAAHQKKIVAMQITSKGLTVYPDQEVFSEFE